MDSTIICGESLPNIDTSNVTSMQEMCYECAHLKTVPNYDTSKVTDFRWAFQNCSSLETAPSFDTSKAFSIQYMFYGCASLKNVPVYDFKGVSTYSVNNVFYGCPLLTNESLNNIMQSMLSASNNLGGAYKTLQHWGLTQTQAATCTTLSNWQALANAGWTTGY